MEHILLNSNRDDSRKNTDSLVATLLSCIYSQRRVTESDAASLNESLNGLKKYFFEKGCWRSAMMAQEMGRLVRAVSNSPVRKPRLSRLESQLLVDSASALLIRYYDVALDGSVYTVPQPLIDGLRSCVEMRNHEIDIPKERAFMSFLKELLGSDFKAL